MRIPFRISTRLLAALTLAAVGGIATVGTTVLITRQAAGELRQQIGLDFADNAARFADQLDRGMFEGWLGARIAVALDDSHSTNGTPKAHRLVVEQLATTLPAYAWIGLADTTGRIQAARGDLTVGEDVSARAWFKAGLTAPYVEDVHGATPLAKRAVSGVSPETARFVDFAAPLKAMDDTTVGVLGARLSWNWARSAADALRASFDKRKETVEVLVLAHDGTVLLGPPLLQGQRFANEMAIMNAHGHWELERSADGHTYIAGVQPTDHHRDYPGLGWTVIVRQEVSAALAPILELQRRILLWGAMMIALVAALAWMGSHLISRPMRALFLAAEALGRGGPVHAPRSLIRGVDRLGHVLARAAAQRQDAEEHLRASEAHLARANQQLEVVNQKLEARVFERTRELEISLQEREAMHIQLLQAQKMDAIGQLTGGVAHDFNNLLTVVLGSLELLRKRIRPDPRNLRLIDTATQSAERGAALTGRMLAFARRQTLRTEAVQVPHLIGGMTDLLQRTLGPMIQIETNFADFLPPARVDVNQLELALLNLSVNARDAMPLGGSLRITVREKAIAGEVALGLASGDYVSIEVRDTGTGMDQETLARAMEPFFTTKGVGKGTGLGLSMVYGFAAQSGGTLCLQSRLGEGTTAELWLPRALEDVVEPEAPAATQAADDCSYRVLVVDDDPLVLSNTAMMLEDLGHIALEASSGLQALELLRNGAPVDLVITDHGMPGMSGTQLAVEIEATHPRLPVLLATGYPDLPSGTNSALPRLAKPFSRAGLAAAVAQIAQAGNAARSIRSKLHVREGLAAGVLGHED